MTAGPLNISHPYYRLVLHVNLPDLGTVISTIQDAAMVASMDLIQAPEAAPVRKKRTVSAPQPPATRPAPPPGAPPREYTADGKLKTPRGENRGATLVLEFMRAAKGPVLISSLERVLTSNGYASGGASARLTHLRKQKLVVPLGDGRWVAAEAATIRTEPGGTEKLRHQP